MSSGSNNNEFNAGNGRFALGLLAFVAFAVGCWFALHPKSPFRPYRNYSVLFPEVGTLREGSAIQVLGMKKGYVVSTTLRDDGVFVRLRIEKMTRIPRDSRFRVVNTGLLGQREVEIRVGSSQDYYEEGDSLRGGYDQGSTRLVFMARALLSSADSLLSTSIGVWDSTLGNPDVQYRLSKVSSGAGRSVDRLGGDMENWRDSLRILQTEVRGALGRIDTLGAELGPGLHEMARGVKGIDTSLESLSRQAALLSQKVDWFSGRLQGSDNSAGLLLQNVAIQSSAKSLVGELRAMMKSIRQKGLDMNIDLF